MDSPQIPISPINSYGAVKSSSSSTKVVDDVTSLTSFNPFSEEDEHDQSSYTLVSSLFTRVKNSLAAPLSNAVAAASGTPSPTPTLPAQPTSTPSDPEVKRIGDKNVVTQNLSPASRPQNENRPRPMKFGSSVGPSLAPPLVTPLVVDSELRDPPTYSVDFESPSTGAFYSPTGDSHEGGLFGTAIPGFPIQDQSDARSIHTTTSLRRSESASKIIRRIRGDGLSRDYWMDDENAKECYLCKSIFTTWRRKHHCRICGQIYCSRCASNIIKGSRLGHENPPSRSKQEGIRVCNLCMEELQQNDDDDDDRRSVFSNISSPFGLGPDGHSQSFLSSFHNPFLGSQIFGRADDPHLGLFSIAESRRHLSGSDGSGFQSRPLTPGGYDDADEWYESGDALAAPFRRGVADEDKDVVISVPFPSDQPQDLQSGNNTPIEFQNGVSISINPSKSTIQFPASSPEHRHDVESPHNGAMRSRVNSYGSMETPTPFLRSRVQSRLDELSTGEIGWRVRRVSTAYAQELNSSSLFHLRIMLRQLLTNEGVPNIREWEETLSKIALRMAKDLTFTTYPSIEGDDMNVRQYVKIKKIPGGSPRDSQYVDGVVITKNVAHRQMTRHLRNPRIMLVTFPLEFQRVEGQYMHFGQIVRQEKEYLHNLVSRIAALRPHIVLAENSVSRLALDALVQQNIAVARSVKPSAIDLVSRMTQGDVFSSMDKLAFESRLGHCGRFEIQTFDHPLIPSRRKTYMKFEGCEGDLGCTIMLRGGDVEQLKRIKKVTLFVACIVRNLKLETHVWKDSLLSVPQLTTDAAPQGYIEQSKDDEETYEEERSTTESVISVPPSASSSAFTDVDDDVKARHLSRRIQESMQPYLTTFISVSATLRFPPPYPIRKMKELDHQLTHARRSWEDEIVKNEEQIIARHAEEATIIPETASTSNTDAEVPEDDISAQIDKLPVPELIDTPDTPYPESKASTDREDSTQSSEYFDHKLASSSSQSSLRSTIVPSSTSQSDLSLEEYQPKELGDIAAQSTFEQVKWRHNEQLRVWEWYLRRNKDDFVVEKYQCLNVLEYTVPVRDLGHRRSCFPPRLVYMKFYGDNDCTLGQFIDKAAHDTWTQFLNPTAVCQGKGCEQSLAVHCSVFLHNESRLIVNVDLWDPQIRARMNMRPKPDVKTTWSVCRVCGHTTPFIAVSEEMQRYSFAKFLELYFYPADVQTIQGAGCPHNVYQHHNRYFSVLGITVMFQSDPINLFEVSPPPLRIHVRSETLLRLKNLDYQRLLKRNAEWYSGLVDDLNLIKVEAATGDEETDRKFAADIDCLISRAISERAEMARLVQGIYKESRPTDTLALNRFRAERQDRIVAWQQDFDKLPKPNLKIGEKESRRSVFGSVRAIWPKRYDLPGLLEGLHLPPSSVLEIDELPSLLRRATREPAPVPTPDLSDAEALPKHEIVLASESSKLSTSDTGKESTESDEGSDSTIGASKGEGIQKSVPGDESGMEEPSKAAQESKSVIPARSRLPRRSGQHPSVAELVKKYQEILPAEVSRKLAICAFPPSLPPISTESDTDGAQEVLPRRRQKSKARQREPQRKDSVSDFEQSYAMNAAPRPITGQLNQTRRRGTVARVTGLPLSSTDSRDSSRRTSPDKRTAMPRYNTEATLRTGRLSPTPGDTIPSETPGKNKPRLSGRKTTRERPATSRQPSASTSKLVPRRTSNAGGPGGKVSNMAKHFEKINRDMERSSRRYAVIRGRRVRPVAPARVKLEVVDSIKEAIKDESYDSSSSSEAENEDEDDGDDEQGGSNLKDSPQEMSMNSSVELKQGLERSSTSGSSQSQTVPAVELTTTDNTGSITLVPGQASGIGLVSPSNLPSPTGLPHTPPAYDGEDVPSTAERHSTIMKALSGFWPQQQATPSRNGTDNDNDDLMADPEHIFRESSMVARTDEPTSVIALALNSPQYRDMLQKSRAEKRLAKEPKVTDGGEAFMPDDMSISDSASTWGVVNVGSSDEANPRDDLRVPSSKLPWAISFESGGLAITCTILYPEQFDALRRTYDCDKVLVESLSRCKSWNASGGKSGSAFLKTKDERFIAKELSKTELESLTTFAPAYFDYMSSAASADRPTTLAKIFGCFKIVLRKVGKGKDKSSRKFQMNLLVMENLFYGREVLTNIYDLKGATRRRRVQASGRPNEVLLDENLMEREHEAPLYLREHSKRILQSALSNDTKFLQDVFVMDYSLLVGVDSQTGELVVGIVDYVRPYTWDKKVENFVKETGFLNGAGEGGPAVMHPKAYRDRFLSAMGRYFPMVPDRWMKYRDLPQSDSST